MDAGTDCAGTVRRMVRGRRAVRKKTKSSGAFDAIVRTQQIACAPFEFQAAVCLRDFGILAYLNEQGDEGATEEMIRGACALSGYALSSLLAPGRYAGLLEERDGRWRLTKTGWFLQNDTMTRANFDFAADVCYRALADLPESLRTGRAAGLAALGLPGPTIYPGLRQLPEPARSSWFRYDHHFSDAAYSECLRHVLCRRPARLFDIGGNTGRWALRCCEADSACCADSCSVDSVEAPVAE